MDLGRLILCPAVVVSLFGCASEQKEYQYQKFIVGGNCEVKFYCRDKDQAQEIMRLTDQELLYLDSLLNFFSEKSLVAALNDNGKAALDPDIRRVFLLADSIALLTGGLFDISIAPLMETWGFYDREFGIPVPGEIERARTLVDHRQIRLTGDSIFIARGMKLDLGGIAQGYAADRVGQLLKDHNVRSAIINIAGEILAIGRPPLGRPWRVGIRNPRAEGVIESVDLEDAALSTSGDYEKYFELNGKRYPHIIDPLTGYPAQEFASVTVFAQTAAFADAMATAVAVMGPVKGKKFLDSLNITGIIYYEKAGMLERVVAE